MDLTVKPSQVTNIVNRAINANRPIFIWGPPGIGKSDIVSQITEDLGNYDRHASCSYGANRLAWLSFP